ncbi:type II secretion system protein GspL [Pararhodobacter sp. SW119]|uniref:type II secretion system protein GspL n=1 Tax=Pararhodobacter sp. SW119 TaxID=2780075 RepID=UPI001AE05CCD|nr:type II secretion system protein GspL [Pararhodobacter sp. SW119]
MTSTMAASFLSVTREVSSETVAPALRFWHVDSSDPPPAADSFIALAPGMDVIALTVSLPSTLRGRAREEVAIRQVYDRLSAKPGSLRVYPLALPGAVDGWTSTLVANEDFITEWQRRLGSASARCRAILPDYLSLPFAPGLWTITVSSEMGRAVVQVRFGAADGFSAETELAIFALTRARATLPAPEAVLCIGPVAPTVETALDGLPLVQSSQALPKDKAPAGVLQLGEEVLDLRKHPVHHGRTVFAKRVRRLRWPLSLFALGALAWAASIEFDVQRYRATADSINEEIMVVVRRDFQLSGSIIDVRIQVEREIERLRRQTTLPYKGNEILEKFREISHVLAGYDDLEIVSAVLIEGEGISLNLLTPDFITLDRITARLREMEGELSILRSTTEPGGHVWGSLFIAANIVSE